MAEDWIAVDPHIMAHYKFMRFRRLMGVDANQALCILLRLWSYAFLNAPDGDLTDFETWELAHASGLSALSDDEETDAAGAALIEALVTSGFIDRDGDSIVLHEWYQWGGRLHYFRANGRAQKNRHRYSQEVMTAVRSRDGDSCRYCRREVDWLNRRGKTGGTYDHVDPEGETSVENLVVACRGCNSKKGRRTPQDAGMRLHKAPSGTDPIANQNGTGTDPKREPKLFYPSRVESSREEQKRDENPSRAGARVGGAEKRSRPNGKGRPSTIAALQRAYEDGVGLPDDKARF